MPLRCSPATYAAISLMDFRFAINSNVGFRGPIPALSMDFSSMHAWKKSPVFCSLAERALLGWAASCSNPHKYPSFSFVSFEYTSHRAWSGGIGFSLFQFPQAYL